jgi:microcystin-dependent protein
VARGAARAIHCNGEAVTLGPCSEGQFVKRQGNKLIGAEITGSGAAWGDITGTLSSQTDLQGALDDKENAGTAVSAVAAHEAAGDPHTAYLTAGEADALYEAAGAVATHAGAADPHPGYLTTAEGDARYSLDGHTHPGGGAAIDAWPVGSVFIAVVATSPATLLGGGTWAAFGAGRMLVGFNSGDTDFDTAEETGGAKTVTLTAAQSGLPQHTHTQNPHTHLQNAHNHVITSQTATTGAATSYEHGTLDTSSAEAEATEVTANATAVNQDATAVNQNAGPTDAAQAHSNMPPYITVYMWKRTA